jgi:hypothetical protein
LGAIIHLPTSVGLSERRTGTQAQQRSLTLTNILLISNNARRENPGKPWSDGFMYAWLNGTDAAAVPYREERAAY